MKGKVTPLTRFAVAARLVDNEKEDFLQ